jgi:exonuclease SbcC
MKLHRLEVTAFGPFAATECVDFDVLNDAGLFLLAGPTGAGKTSLLDAVCFALYGTVPGVRGVKALKSQHADDQVEPRVVLELSVRDRRFRITRSPEWTRPKRRGTGTRTENAKATLVELTGGAEQFLSSRASEVGQLVSDLIGMRAGQFQQVAMLPQGEFQRFLHASSQERHDVLQHLFHTDRFGRIEEWVHDHSRTLRTRTESAHQDVRRLVHTIADRCDAEVRTEVESGMPDDAAGRWAQEVLATAVARLEELQTARVLAEAEEATTAAAAEEARRLGEVAHRRDEARATLAQLSATEQQADLDERRLDDDRRAASCRSVLALLETATADRRMTAASRDRAVERLAALEVPEALRGLLPSLGALSPAEDVDVAAVDAAVEEVRDLTSVARSLVPRGDAARSHRERAGSVTAELEQLAETTARLEQVRETLPARIDAARAAVESATDSGARREALELRLADARTRADAAARLPRAQARADELGDGHRDARDATADARELVQTLQARRLAGIAAELAGALRDGDPCQVCGSTEHPRPARSGSGPVTEREQDDAARAYEAAQARLVEATERLAAQQAELATLRAAAGDVDARRAAQEVEDLARELAVAVAAAARLPRTQAELTDLQASRDGLLAELQTARRTAATLEEKRLAALAAAEDAEAQIGQALPGVAPEELVDVTGGLDDLGAALTRARVALVQHEQACRRVDDLTAQVTTSAAELGFRDLDAVRSARLGAGVRTELEEALQRRQRQAVVARDVLASTEVRELPAVLPDPQAAAAAGERARSAAREAACATDLHSERVEALRSLVARLEEALERWRPLHEEHVRAESMSRLVRGMGSDNHLQMRLSAYVLATRLDQVLDAANERLAEMRDQRYLLQRTGRAARKGSRAGLGLEVLDQWTGDVRDPATLSGGETFVVSLSLALGLADVVTQEAGGTEIETLFVDEGFGTLDPDTLDDVMDRLDGLRAGGRTVGVISHVTELRTRIAAQVHVHKTPRGSTVHAETLVG